jgi:hypothetical protein
MLADLALDLDYVFADGAPARILDAVAAHAHGAGIGELLDSEARRCATPGGRRRIGRDPQVAAFGIIPGLGMPSVG